MPSLKKYKAFSAQRTESGVVCAFYQLTNNYSLIKAHSCKIEGVLEDFYMQRFNKKGFTLIELMVVVGIIGVIALIAVPNFNRFQAKAKQANAKTELASMYGMQKAFFTEFSQYHSNLWLIGYTPDGYPPHSSKAGCPSDASNITTGPVRYYKSGSSTNDFGVISGIGSITCTDVIAYAASGADHTLTSTMSTSAFTLQSMGTVTSGLTDVWTINDSKKLENATMGL